MDIVFVVMPFADVGRPAIGVSLLKSAARDAGFSAAIHYENVRMAERMGVDLYQKVSSGFPPEMLLGEWFFADDLFGDEIPPAEDYVEQILQRGAPADVIDGVIAARAGRQDFLDRAARRIADLSPAVVGFTTTFHQTCGSLAVARRLKAMPHPPVIVFGGANCEGEMGLQLLRSFDWIDYICCGEADLSFPALLGHLLRGEPAPEKGVLRQGHSTSVSVSEAIQDLNTLPYPDYHDYFAELEKTTIGRDGAYHVIVETSRGCWWGAKHHCTFCGLNGETMAFRSKTPERAFDEIAGLCRTYGAGRVGCVDNILDMRYIDTLFPRLADSGLQLELFYEVKANLRYDQLLRMHRGGVRQIQPGIESFSDAVLRLMDKGVTGFQNIQLLRWCEEIGIECAWNVLGGFPGESPADYAKMADLVPLLTHLNPPCSCGRVRLDRFSPFHARAGDYGFRNLRPARAYFFVFPLGRQDLSRLAYFFDFDYDDGRKPFEYLEPLQNAVARWWRARSSDNRPALVAEFDGDEVRVTDTREAAVRARVTLSGLQARVLAFADSSTTAAAIVRHPDFVGQEREALAALEALVSDRLVACEGKQYVSLPVFRNRPVHFMRPKSHAYQTVAEAAPAHTFLRMV